MFEELLVLAILAETDLIKLSCYLERLNNFFLNEPENKILLELEFLYKDINEAIYILQNLSITNQIDYHSFGKILFKEIEKVYLSNSFTINDFGQKIHLIWNLYIPNSLYEQEPFWTLSYADDCLSYGDEKQTRELYEEAFQYYN
ncbi:hypothetical protein [Vagococcus fluvialis]|uniref:hypothetical protein n=1 Tax=Vagococcus fluvialis TaxID=2738 RepID=UPI003B5A0071